MKAILAEIEKEIEPIKKIIDEHDKKVALERKKLVELTKIKGRILKLLKTKESKEKEQNGSKPKS